MGFSGGGSNVLLPHTHDGRISQDGGPLQFNNVTQSQSAQGEIFYSDGVALQQLAYPGVPAGETLTASPLSVAPSWAAAAPASTVWSELADVSVVNSPLSSGVFAAHDLLDIWIKSANTGSSPVAMTFNNSNGLARYNNNQWQDDVYSSASGTAEITICGSNLTTNTFIHMSVFNPSSGEVGFTWQAMNFNGVGSATPISLMGWGKYHTDGQVTRVDRTNYGGSAINQTGRMIVLGAN
jgi:hypothetical protein